MNKFKVKLSLTLCILLVLLTPSRGHSACDVFSLATGIAAGDYIMNMTAMCEFLRKGDEKLKTAKNDPNVKLSVMTTGHFLTLQSEGVSLHMVVGRSADYKTGEENRIRV